MPFLPLQSLQPLTDIEFKFKAFPRPRNSEQALFLEAEQKFCEMIDP